MNKEIISTKQGIFLVIILILGTSLTITGGGKAQQDMWISILLAILAAIPFAFIHGKILSFFPNKNLYEILEIAFGKIIGKIISTLYILYFIYLGSLCIRNITEFIQVVSFPETPQIFSALWIIILTIYMIKSGIEVFARWTNSMIVFLFFLIFLITSSSFAKFNFENIKPILYNGWKPVFQSAFTSFTFPFGEIVVFLSFFHNLKEQNKVTKTFLMGLFIGGAMLLMTALRNMFLLGFPNLENTYFPTYYANTLLSIGGFIQRVEITSAIILVLSGFAKICIYSFAVCIGVNQLFNQSKYDTFAIPINLITMILSIVIYKNTMEMIEGVEIYKYIALPFQVILPPIILIFAYNKRARSKT